MTDNPKFKSKFDELLSQKSSLAPQPPQVSDDTPCYVTGETRTINFRWLDGKQQMFSYSYLVSAEYENTDKDNIITLHFTSHEVTLKGYRLAGIYEEITQWNVVSVKVTDTRYAAKAHQNTPVVTGIFVEEVD